MAATRGNLDQKNRNGQNPEDFSDIIDIQEETQAGIDNLKQSTIDYSLSTASAKSDLTIEKTGLEYERDMHTLVGFLSVLDKLLEEIKDTRKGISKKGLSKAGKKTMDEAETKLKQYEDKIKDKRKGLMKQTRSEITEHDIATVKNLREQLNKVKNDISKGQWGEYSSTASYLYDSPEIAKKSNKQQIDSIELNQKLQKELKNGAVLSIFGGDVQRANSYYRRIAENEYDNIDYQLYLDNESVLTPSFQRCGITIPSETGYQTRETRYYTGDGRYYIGNGKNPERVSGTPHRVTDYSNMDWGDTLQKGGVAGVLDKLLSNCKNMTPGQRETWRSLGILACFAGGIYGLYKFYTNKNMGLRKKAGITAGVIFGSQFLTGEGPISLFNKLIGGGLSIDELKSKFGNAVGGLGLSGSESTETVTGGTGETVSETIVPAMYSMMIFNSSTKVSDINTMTQSFSNNDNRKVFYEGTYNTLKKEYGKYGTEAAEYFRTTFSDEYDEEKWKNRLASFGVTDNTDPGESLYGLANNASMNKIILEKFQTENGLIVTDKKALNAYVESKRISNQPIDVDDLNSHINTQGTDRFKVNEKATNTQRPEDIQNKRKLTNNIDSLSIDSTQKEELKQAIQDFYDKRSIESKPKLNDFSLRIENGLLIMKSHHGNETEIDISKRTLKSKNNINIAFPTLSEALNVADLTNYVLYSTNKKSPVDLPPFEYQIPQKAICFNDKGTLQLDTRVISINWISNRTTIDKHSSIYASYLSERRKEVNKLNLTNYPLVKQLGINFYSNENEVKKLENYLKGVKEKLKVFKCHPDGNPFTIEVLTNRLKFKAINGDTEYFDENISKEFPTLNRKGNEKKFLNAINNPANKMRGTVFN